MSPATTTRRLPEVAELRAVLRAVRTTPTGARLPVRRLVTAGFLAILLGILHTAQSAAWNPSPPRPRPSHEEFQMSFPKIPSRGTAAIVAAAAAASSIPFTSTAAAQDAVQWRVEDGGNGHWYQAMIEGLGWLSARNYCDSEGGHLVTLGSSEELSWLMGVLPERECSTSGGHWHIGAFRSAESPEPAGFEWVTGEPFRFTAWASGQPSNSTSFCPEGEDAVAMWGPSGDCGSGSFAGEWNDVPACDGGWGPGFIIEWSSDCNMDGIVDYGQCRDGSLPDYNGNNIPDCCEQSATCVAGTYPVEWKKADGGNGHWYQRVNDAGLSWQTARDNSLARGGHLATLTTSDENIFISSLFPSIATGPGYWFGGVKVAGEWTWVTGEPWDFVSWGSSADGCNDQPDGRDATDIYCIDSTGIARWSDDYLQWPNAAGYVIEWSADCNSDGIVDYGQILAGELVDTNANNVPDCCEGDVPCGCGADFNGDGSVTSADFANLLTAWGATDLPPEDLDRNGIVDANDMAILLDSWGPCR